MNLTKITIPTTNYDTSQKPKTKIVIHLCEPTVNSFSIFPMISTSFMKFIMFKYRQKNKIFRSIIKFILIYMVNFLNFRINFSTEFLFHNNNMNKFTTIFMSRIITKISPFINTYSTFPIKMFFSSQRKLFRELSSITGFAGFSLFGGNRMTTVTYKLHNNIIL